MFYRYNSDWGCLWMISRICNVLVICPPLWQVFLQNYLQRGLPVKCRAWPETNSETLKPIRMSLEDFISYLLICFNTRHLHKDRRSRELTQLKEFGQHNSCITESNHFNGLRVEVRVLEYLNLEYIFRIPPSPSSHTHTHTRYAIRLKIVACHLLWKTLHK